MNKNAKIFLAGHRGLAGSAILRRLRSDGYQRIITADRTRLDLRNQQHVHEFFEKQRPEYVFLAAAKVGGIVANRDYPAEFIFDNLAIQTNVIDASYRSGVRKLLFLGSSCIYPRCAPQPIRESDLLTGTLESTNEAYAVAKIAGIKLLQAYRQQYGFHAISLMPTNLYGPGDKFDLQASHVVPALMRKFHEATENGDSEVVVWGTGTPRREFLFVDDMASAASHFMLHYHSADPINVGTGQDVTIAELAELMAAVTGFPGKIVFDHSKPDGTPRKLLDVSKAFALGWQPEVSLFDGLNRTYDWFVRYKIANLARAVGA
jgi:GDP-L-fucose synthase